MTIKPKTVIYTKNSLNQAGVTLMLAILVLSALVAISFSFASIILIEIRSSGDLVRTEPAYYAVQGVVEETIYKIKRVVPDTLVNENDFYFGGCGEETSVSAGVNVATQNLVSLSSGICSTNPDFDVKDIVPPTPGADPQNTSNIYNLYDPLSPYTNTYEISGTQYPSAYSKIQFEALLTPGAFVEIYFCPADVDCFSTGGWNVKTLVPGGRSIVYDDKSFPSISPDKAYQFFVVNSNPNLDAGIQIKSYGPDPRNDPQHPTKEHEKGLPVFGQFSVSVTAGTLGLTRKYQVDIPN